MKVIVKAIILLVIVFIYNYMMQFISPIIANELAMNQMNNNADSSLGIQVYTYISNNSGLAMSALVVAMFYEELLNLAKKIINIFKGE